MKNLLPSTRSSFCLALLGLLATAAPAVAQSPAAASATAAAKPAVSLAQQLDDYVQLYAQAGLFNGSVLVADQGRVVLQKGYGLADRAAGTLNAPDTKFRIGSLTKQFTAALVLKLVEQGKLKLDGRVGDYLPDYPSAAGRALTLHQLLSHTAGLPEYLAQPAFAAVSTTPQTPTQLVAIFANLPLDFAPGTQHKYSNSNYILLGAIIEKVTGQPYARVFDAQIARPAKLRATAYTPTEPADARRAAGYRATPAGIAPAAPINMSVPFAAGAITSTVADLYRWNQALLGTKVLSATSQRLLFTPVKDNYAYGWMVFKARIGTAPDTVLIQEHNGAVNGFASYLVRVPQRQQCIVLLDNHSNRAGLAELRRGLLRLINHQPVTPPSVAAAPAGTAPSAPVTVPVATLNTYVGVYELNPNFRITVRQRDSRLFVQATGQSEFETDASSPVLFTLRGVPAQVEFGKNEKGEVAHLYLLQSGRRQAAPRVE
ncbi:serine hydrolase [Hymenobacter sp. DH14]|uniref:Serine hydrolase n=1 Tax=Hymenobacter cyanobacteriorum TaxID=2926463 RepID=A0A9X2AFU3_9BACT|nr:serine hydrolase [Hymenobacter cyanobacteriorum]MCI1188541.1 serine hydrolase [Hymenobacter cyanobacteriorum]